MLKAGQAPKAQPREVSSPTLRCSFRHVFSAQSPTAFGAFTQHTARVNGTTRRLLPGPNLGQAPRRGMSMSFAPHLTEVRKQRHGDDLTQVTQLGSGSQMGTHSVWLQSPSSSCVLYCIPNLPNLFEILLSFCFCQKTSSSASFLDPKNNPMSPSNYSSCNPLPRCWGNWPWFLANICT